MRTFVALLLLATAANAQWVRDGQRIDRIPDPLPMGNGFARFNPTEDDFLATGARRATPEEIAGWQAEAEAGVAAADAARIAELAQTYGPAVMALQQSLVTVGWSIPCNAAEVSADLIHRSVAGLLTADQERAKGNVSAIYTLLRAQGISNKDLSDIYAAVVAAQ